MRYLYTILLVLFAFTLVVGCGQKENKNLVNARNLIAKEKYQTAREEIRLAVEAEPDNAEARCTSEILTVIGKQDAGAWRTVVGRVLEYIAPLNADIKDLQNREAELDDDELAHLKTLIRQKNNSIGFLVKTIYKADENGEAWVQEIAANSTSLFVKVMLEAGGSYDIATREIAAEKILSLGEKAIDELIAELQNDSSTIRRQAVLFLGKLRATSAIAPLSRLLTNKSEDFEVLYGITVALEMIGYEAIQGESGRRQITDALRLVLKTNAAQARMYAAKTLGRLKAEDAAIEDLMVLLADDNAYVKTVTVEALTAIGPPVIDRMLNILEQEAENVIPDETPPEVDYIANVYIDEDREEARRNSVQSSAITILGNILAKGGIKNRESDGAIKRLINLLEDDDLRASAVTALTNIGGAAVEPLSEALANSNTPNKIRINAVLILGDINDLRAAKTLVSALMSDENKEVKANAAEALGKMKERKATTALTRALNAPDEKTRINAITALGEIKPLTSTAESSEAVAKLMHIASDKNERETVRTTAIVALGGIKPEEAIDLLIRIMLSEDETDVIRQKATWALGEIKAAKAVPPMLWILSTLRDDIKGFKRHIKGKYHTITKLNEGIEKLNVDWQPNYQQWTDVKPIPGLVRSEVAISLGKIKGVEVVKPLIKSLKDDKRAAVRKSAAWSLGEIKGDDVIGPLIDALGDDDVGIVRNEAAVALGKIKGEKVIVPLSNALRKDKYETTRKNAAIGLREVKFASAAAVLVGVLKSQPHKSDEEKETKTVIDEIVTALIKDGIVATKPLISALKSKGEEYIQVRKQAAHAIGSIADAAAVDEMIAALQDESVIVRERAAALLGGLKQRKAVEPLIKTLNDDQEWKSVRARAADSLGILRDERAVAPLLAVLNNENLEIRNSAVVALGNIKDGRAVEPLIQLIENRLADETIRNSAIAALGKIDDSKAEGIILNVLNEETGTLQYSAITALGQLGSGRALSHPAAVDKLMDILTDRSAHPTARKNAATALKNIGDERAAKNLEQVIVDETEYNITVIDSVKRNVTWEVFVNAAREFALSRQAAPKMIDRLDDTWESKTSRSYAALALGRTGTEEAIKRLNEALSDSVVDVTYAAARALGETKRQDQIKTLVDIMTDTAKAKDLRRAATQGLQAMAALSTVKDLIGILQDTAVHEEIRRDAAIALGNIGNAEAISALVDELEKTDLANLQSDIVTALVTAKSQAAVPLLKSRLDDENADIHFNAAEGLYKITGDGQGYQRG